MGSVPATAHVVPLLIRGPWTVGYWTLLSDTKTLLLLSLPGAWRCHHWPVCLISGMALSLAVPSLSFGGSTRVLVQPKAWFRKTTWLCVRLPCYVTRPNHFNCLPSNTSRLYLKSHNTRFPLSISPCFGQDSAKECTVDARVTNSMCSWRRQCSIHYFKHIN